jgi:hypothetical protein
MRTLDPGFLKASGALRQSRSHAGRSIRDEAFCTKTGGECSGSKGLANSIRVNAVAPGPFWMPLQVTGGQPADKLPEFGANTL